MYEMGGWVYEMHHFFIIALIIVLPIFLSTPALDMGMPVARLVLCLACVMPNARFHEKERPEMGVDFLVMFDYLFVYNLTDSLLSSQALPCAMLQ